ncbi:redoxin domain-containing protein [bacterium]|nr:redoxin domain-containing protein [bacterium]
MSEEELVVGSPIPVFSLPSTTGGDIGISDYPGKKIILFFVREYI